MADFGLIGLAVMGENLALNVESRGFKVAVYNRTTSKVDAFLAKRGHGKNFVGAHSPAELCAALSKPRKVMMLVQAGSAVDATIEGLLPHLEAGDVVIDGGNSHFPDTTRRAKYLAEKKILFIGAGVSGGEEGALLGPSIMPGGAPEAWPLVKPIFQAICAKVDDGSPCCDWVGQEGSGHYTKMVHNGIEYGDMQLIAEAYSLLKGVAGMTNDELAATFAEWNKGDLSSFLIEITAQIFAKRDDVGSPDDYLIDKILDKAGQKGTGKWTVMSALDTGMPVTLIAEAVFARAISALKSERVAASASLLGPDPSLFKLTGSRAEFVEAVRNALYASKLVSYAQGYQLLAAAAREFGWKLNYGGIALMWRGGCIIRSTFLGKIKEAFDRNPELPNLLLDDFFRAKIQESQSQWRTVISAAVLSGVPVPAMSTALAYYDGYRSAAGPANLTQAQRDFFGAHQYERTDKPAGEWFHCNWTGRGGDTSSSTYNA